MRPHSRDPKDSAYGNVWSDGTFLHQNRPTSTQAESQQPGKRRKRRPGRGHKTDQDRDQSQDSDWDDNPDTDDARSPPPPPPSASNGVSGAGIRRPSVAGQDGFFAHHPEYPDPGNRHAGESRWQAQLDELNLKREDRRGQSTVSTAATPYQIPVAKMLSSSLPANADDADSPESQHSFNSLFDEPPAKKTRSVIKRITM